MEEEDDEMEDSQNIPSDIDSQVGSRFKNHKFNKFLNE
jgi:hypothetical protein